MCSLRIAETVCFFLVLKVRTIESHCVQFSLSHPSRKRHDSKVAHTCSGRVRWWNLTCPRDERGEFSVILIRMAVTRAQTVHVNTQNGLTVRAHRQDMFKVPSLRHENLGYES